MKNYIKLVLPFVLLLIMAGCASFYNVSVEDKPAPYKEPTQIEESYSISGRFYIQHDNKTEYGNFTWDKTLTEESLAFRTPLGQTVAQISIKDNIVTLEAKDKIYTGENLDTMMRQRLGFTLPLNLLHYWIQGKPLPNEAISKTIEDGFIQLGWKVEYLQWQDPNHPHVIQCSKDNLLIKLLIEW